jgi:hypothetical protein
VPYLFSRIWGESEPKYSAVLAQTLALSARYRSLLLLGLAEQQQVDPSITDRLRSVAKREAIIETEKNLGEGLDKIDIFVSFDSVLAIGIENKKTAGLGKDQLLRYQDGLCKEGLPNLLVFLSPSSYPLPMEELGRLDRQRFVRLDYGEVIRLAKECLKASGQSGFEHDYFEAFLEFMGELEMKPFSNEELTALAMNRSYQDAFGKARSIVAKLAGDDRPERNSTSSFWLTWTNRFPEFSLPIYRGIRLDNNWYFDEPLLGGKPEVLAYVKDDETNAQKAEKTNRRLKDAAYNAGYIDSLGAGYIDSLSAKVKYFERDPGNQKQCRLAIRRPLGDFADEDPEEIVGWLKDATARLEEVLRTLKEPI